VRPVLLAEIYFDLGLYDEALDACDLCLEIIRSDIDIYIKPSFNVKKCIQLRKLIIETLNNTIKK